MSEPCLEPRCDKNCAGFRYFYCILNGTKIEANDQDLVKYAAEDLRVSWEKLTPKFTDYLPSILMVYMKNWTGWSRREQYFEGTLGTEQYFSLFQKYMKAKLESIIDKHFATALKEVEAERKRNAAKPKQIYDLETAPFAITLQCPAAMINTVLFTNADDHVIMKDHAGPKWPVLDITKLLNWPYIEVEFISEDLHFRRVSATEVTRYLDLEAQHLRLGTGTIERAELIDKKKKQEVFTLRYVHAYIKDYFDALEKIRSMRLVEIKEILQHLLNDINHMGINSSIATNTDIMFKLSKYPYMRNKKLVKSQSILGNYEHVVGYCELVHPKVRFALIKFKGEQTESNPLLFKYPAKIRTDSVYRGVFAPEINYTCTFCKVTFVGASSLSQMILHLNKLHSMEQGVKCVLCQKQQDIVTLTQRRWQHKGCLKPKTITATT